MEIRPECHACLRRLVELTVAQATPDPALQQQARRASLEIIAREFRPEAIPAGIANQFHHAIMAVTGNPDPFASPEGRRNRLSGPQVPGNRRHLWRRPGVPPATGGGGQCHRFFPG